MNSIKFAVATDNSAEPSYYCKDNKFYRSTTKQDVTTTDLPYSAFWTYPALFDGHFINLTNSIYPDEQFDLIFAAIECNAEYLDILKYNSLYTSISNRRFLSSSWTCSTKKCLCNYTSN